MTARVEIPVIDLFAGPGGLGEGFSCLRTPTGQQCFDVRLSIEKDPVAHRTLELRALFKSTGTQPPEIYYDYIKGKVTRDQLFEQVPLREHVRRARHEAWNLELSLESHKLVTKRVKEALPGAPDVWVLIGGPPCQAYSLVGRSRMMADGLKEFEQDARHFLYREYLRILEEHAPPIFIMENVKGLLSAKHGGTPMFERIVEDLSNAGPKYVIHSLADPDVKGSGYVIRAEEFGVPQARHRVILCGVRSDLSGRPPPLTREDSATVADALSGLPPLRSRLSKEPDSYADWLAALQQSIGKVRRSGRTQSEELADLMESSLQSARAHSDLGSAFMKLAPPEGSSAAAKRLQEWYRDPHIDGVSGHQSRSHMRSDLHRYFFAANYAALHGVSPRIRDFPASLIPSHENLRSDDGVVPFQDRFRVQVRDKPSTTVVSHISKDGHYFIHPDPAQCRSLTVREAARLQTFPDNYHFEGNRTQQFVQVGNAVPPYLAAKIAEAVYQIASGEITRPGSADQRAARPKAQPVGAF
jgi:DNA (cytosine-5)-methyltransferase 1